MNKEAYDVLVETKNILSDPEYWARGDLIIGFGRPDLLLHPKYCLMGALGKAKGFSDEQLHREADNIYEASKNSDGSGRILSEAVIDYVTRNRLQFPKITDHDLSALKENPSLSWYLNDRGTYEDVISVLDLAIQKAESK